MIIDNTWLSTDSENVMVIGLEGSEISIYCVNTDGTFTIKRAYDIQVTRDVEVIEVVTERKSVICTHDQPFKTKNRGWILAEDLTTDDILYERLQNDVYVQLELDDNYPVETSVIDVKPVPYVRDSYSLIVEDLDNYLANSIVVKIRENV